MTALALGSWSPCCLEPGETGRFFANFDGEGSGIATYGGETYTNLGGPFSANNAQFEIVSSPFTAPPAAGGPSRTTVAVPFTLTGTFRGLPGDGRGGEARLFATLTGTGVAQLPLTFFSVGGPWTLENPHLDITAPTPEPTALLLLGLGLAAIWSVGAWRRALRVWPLANGTSETTSI